MSQRKRVENICTVAVAMTLTSIVWAQGAGKIGEAGIRAAAIAAPKPAYPAALLAKKTTGVSVVSLIVDTEGKPRSVIVLDAPDPLMAESARTAVERWTFHPITAGGRPVAMSSKLTFYFQVRNGAGVVLNPDEMPGGRRASPPPPRAASQPPAGAPPPPPPMPPAVRMGGHDTAGLEISRAEFDRRAGTTGVVVLDSRDRDAFRRNHHPRAINIPFDEMDIRASIEIPAGSTVLLDCSGGDEFSCSIAAHDLTGLKYRVSVLKP